MSAPAEMLTAVKDTAKQAKTLHVLAGQVLANNSAKGLDWNSIQSSDIGGEDPANVSNVLGSLDAFQTFWNTHGGNFEKLTTPIV